MRTAPTPPRQAPPGQTRWHGLDGIRALAVIAVAVFHFDPAALRGGFLGVDVFFVLSGYLITRLLLQEIVRTGRLSFGQFYLRRARRLLPAAFALIGVVALAASLFWRDELPILRGAVTSSLVYVTNWWQVYAHQSYFVSTGRPSMLQHLWSLAVEEQFYLIWPIVLVSVIGYRAARQANSNRLELSPRRLSILALVAGALAVASTTAMAVIAIRTDVPYRADSSRIYFGTDTHSAGLLLGAAVAALVVRNGLTGRPRRRRSTLGLTDLLGLVAILGVVFMAARVSEFSVDLYRGGFLLVSALAVVAVSATARPGSLLGRALDVGPFRWLGRRSYAIYLWHWPVAVVTRPDLDVHAPAAAVFALRCGLTLALACASYALIEVPVRARGWTGLLAAWHIPTSGRGAPRKAVLAGLALSFVLIVGNVVTARSGSEQLAWVSHTAAARTSPTSPAPPVATASTTRPPFVAAPHETSPAARGSSAATHSAAPQAKTRPVTAAFGDSVMVGAEGYLRQQFPGIAVDAVEGQQPWVTLANVATSTLAHAPGATVVIDTGNNGVIPPGQLRSVLRSLQHAKRILVVNDRVPRDWQDPNNATLREIVPQYRNAVLGDWYHQSAQHSGWLYPDGIHLRPEGALSYAHFLSSELESRS